MVEFLFQGQTVNLAARGHFARPKSAGFRDTTSEELTAIVHEIGGGRAWRDVVQARYAETNPWLHQIIASPARTAFFSEVLPANDGLVLDIGAGWGQVARPLAAQRPVIALEPVSERMAFIRAAAAQDGVDANLAYVECDYLDAQFSSRFTLICAIGVLEWAGAFQSESDPQERQRVFLAKTRQELAPGGCLVLGIENRLGLKYLLGCPDDHVGVPGISLHTAAIARRRWQEAGGHTLQSFTYTRAELEQLLRDAGYQEVEFFAAFPDYKLPQVVLPMSGHGARVNGWLSQEPPPPEHNGYDGSLLDGSLQESLADHYRSLAVEGTAHLFAPSFFVRAR